MLSCSKSGLWSVCAVFPENTARDVIETCARQFEMEIAAVPVVSVTLYAEEPKITLLCTTAPDLEALSAQIGVSGVKITVAPLPERDWLQHVHENFPPIVTGRFFIYGSHYAGTLPENLIPLQIDAATAFGSGEHGTTAACLLALEYLWESGFVPGTALDLGCGSGILALALAKLWPLNVHVCDIDDEAVRVTERHAAANTLSARLCVFRSDGFNAPEIPETCDLIVANILAEPLIHLASGINSHLAQNGVVVLSGILDTQAKRVFAAYERLGFEKIKEFNRDGWATLVLRRRNFLVK